MTDSPGASSVDRIHWRTDLVMLALVTDGCHAKEHQRQHHEDQGLHEADEDLKNLERDRQQEGDEERHGCQHDFTGEDIAK